MPPESRRLSERRRLERPLEAELLLCKGRTVSGWIIDEQDDGVGMAFGADDVPRLMEHRTCCVSSRADLWLADFESRGRPIPVWLAHVTEGTTEGTCRAGLSFDVARMRAEDITHLLAIWRRLMAVPNKA
ncbi:MAG: hypothetical protein ACYTG6_13070 [Planctomycetota bacterium]|jgi:hypothetical protein